MDRVRDRAADVARNGVEMGKQTWTGIKSMLRAGVNQLESLANDDIASGLRRHAGGAGLPGPRRAGASGVMTETTTRYGVTMMWRRRRVEWRRTPRGLRTCARARGSIRRVWVLPGRRCRQRHGTWVREVVGAGGTFGGWEDEDNDDGTMHATSEVEGEAKATETAREEKGDGKATKTSGTMISGEK